MRRIFKLKRFARFQRKERISDLLLYDVVVTIEAGLIDADLGGGLVKQRLARRGRGKSGSYRTVIAFRHGDMAFFLFGFAKNERSTLAPIELDEFKRLAKAYLNLTKPQLVQLIALGELIEVHTDKGAPW